MDNTVRSSSRAWLAAAWWWLGLVAALVIMDDLMFGSVFWVLSLVLGNYATLAAFVLSFAAQLALSWAAMRRFPHPWVGGAVNRLLPVRKHLEYQQRQESLLQRAVSSVGAVLVSLLVGGVLPVVLMYRRGGDVGRLRKLAVITAAVYAAEFALLHGNSGMGAALRSMLGWVS
jgi:hypothetical protein